jgi:hypothetical protein
MQKSSKSQYVVSCILFVLSITLLLVLSLARPPPPTPPSPEILENALHNMSTNDHCACLVQTTSKPNEQIVRFGEDTPVLVPDTMPPIPQDIMDKLTANRDDDNTILVTVADYAKREYVYNWIQLLKNQHTDQDEPPKFVVFCSDPKLHVHLIVAGYESNAVLIPDEWTGQAVTSRIVQRLVYTNLNILLLDVDVIMLRDPRPFMSTLLKIRADTHLLVAQSGVNQHRVDPGMMLIRANSRHARRIVAQTMDSTWEMAFNKALDAKELHVKEGMVVLLDPVHFSNKETYVDRQLSTKLGITPYLVHLNKVSQVFFLKNKGETLIKSIYIYI